MPTFNRDELILERLKDIKEGQRELKADLQAAKHELNDRIDKLDGRMNKLENEVRNSVRHTQIMTVSVVGVGRVGSDLLRLHALNVTR